MKKKKKGFHHQASSTRNSRFNNEYGTYGDSSFMPVFFHEQYNDEDLDIFEDMWSHSLAGDVVDTRIMHAMGEGIKPTFELLRPNKIGDENAQKKELEKYAPLLDELIIIDNKSKINFFNNLYDIATQAKVFGRSVLAFEPGGNMSPVALKPIHPRFLGRVFIHQSDWTLSSVYTQTKLKQLTYEDEMIYLVNKKNSPRFRNMHYGFSDFQRIAGQARTLREITEFDMIEIVKTMFAGYGIITVDQENLTDDEKIDDQRRITSNLKSGAFSVIGKQGEKDIEFNQFKFDTDLAGLGLLIDKCERMIIGHGGVPGPMLGREEEANMACYSADTLTLTENGWKAFHEIDWRKEKIATLNPNTNEIQYHYPDGIAVYDYMGDMIHIKSRNQDIMVTPNHDMWVTQSHDVRYQNWHKLRADKLEEKSEWTMRSFGEWNGVKIPEQYPLQIVQKQSHQTVQVANMDVKLWLEFLGYYISEGTKSKPDSTAYFVSISQHVESKHYEKFQKCMQNLPFNFYENYNNTTNVQSWRFSSKQLVKNLEDTGLLHDTKCIPRWVLNTTKDNLEIIFNALISGDGSISEYGTKTYYTTSYQLAQDVQEIALKLGYSSTIKNHFDGEIIAKKRNKDTSLYSDGWRVFISKEKRQFRRINRRHISKVPYNGKVYCFNVKNHLFVTSRNGTVTVQGNTLYGKMRMFLHGPVRSDRKWMSDTVGVQWYEHNLNFIDRDVLNHVRVVPQFKSLPMDAWMETIDGLLKLKKLIPGIPDEEILRLAELGHLADKIQDNGMTKDTLLEISKETESMELKDKMQRMLK